MYAKKLSQEKTHELRKWQANKRANDTGECYAVFYADGKANPEKCGYLIMPVSNGKYRHYLLDVDWVRIHITD